MMNIEFEGIIDAIKTKEMCEYGIEHISCLIGFTYELEAFLKKTGLLNAFWESLEESGKSAYDCIRTSEMYEI